MRTDSRIVGRHMHNFDKHPNPGWSPTHVACTICGCALSKSLLEYAIKNGARLAWKSDEYRTLAGDHADRCRMLGAKVSS